MANEGQRRDREQMEPKPEGEEVVGRADEEFEDMDELEEEEDLAEEEQ